MSCAHSINGACGPCYKSVLRTLEVTTRDLSAARSDLALVKILRDTAIRERAEVEARLREVLGPASGAV